MSLRDIADRREDHRLKAAILNCFALLTDEDILRVCDAIGQMSGPGAASTIIGLLGPESARVATILPAMWAPATLASESIAAQLVTAAGNFRGKDGPSKAELHKAVDALELSPSEKQSVHIDVEKTAVSALDWAFLGRMLASGVVAILQRRLPMLKYAENIPALIRGIGTVGGAIYGAEHEIAHEREAPALPPQR